MRRGYNDKMFINDIIGELFTISINKCLIIILFVGIWRYMHRLSLYRVILCNSTHYFVEGPCMFGHGIRAT